MKSCEQKLPLASCYSDPEPFAPCHSERNEESNLAQGKLREESYGAQGRLREGSESSPRANAQSDEKSAIDMSLICDIDLMWI
jgi:hypothetical protein